MFCIVLKLSLSLCNKTKRYNVPLTEKQIFKIIKSTAMKKNNQLFSTLSKEQVDNLTTEVKETIAVGYTPVKQFGSVDMWNVRRQRRSLSSRRSLV